MLKDSLRISKAGWIQGPFKSQYAKDCVKISCEVSLTILPTRQAWGWLPYILSKAYLFTGKPRKFSGDVQRLSQLIKMTSPVSGSGVDTGHSISCSFVSSDAILFINFKRPFVCGVIDIHMLVLFIFKECGLFTYTA